MDQNVLVLPSGVHGMSVDGYASALRERLPEATVWRPRTNEAVADRLPEATVATGYRLDAERVERAPNLELFQTMFAGTDHLPLDAFKEAGVAVASASGVHAPNVAEHAIGGALSLTRRFQVARRRAKRREWRHFQAGEMAGSTATVVGLGPIGKAIVRRLEAFDMDTIGVRYTPEKGGPGDEVIGFGDAAVESALARSEYLFLACPLTETTRELIDGDAFDVLPPSAILVNVARGGVVDTDALVDTLRANEIRGAALDVTDPEPLPEEHPLWTFENVLITPHNAGHTPAYYERLSDITAHNVRRIDEGKSGEPTDKSGGGEGLENQVVL
jgi:phosphoglycerate dehydrogenase-like enzyme